MSIGLGAAQQITWSRVVGGLSALIGQAAPDGCGWPCWSPDGRWLAGFRTSLSPEGGPSAAFVAQVDGVEERELFARPDERPIYLQWSPDGRALGLLCQRDEELLLYCIDVEGGGIRLVHSGVPLFFSWGPDSEQFIIHAGAGTRRARLVCSAAGGSGEDVIFPPRPGSFCTPLLVPGKPPRVAFATRTSDGSASKVCTADLDGTHARHIATLHGLLAVVPDQEGRRVAVASAPGGEGTPYDGLWLADLQGGPLVQVSAHELMAFFWCRGGQRLVYAALDHEAGCARWYRCDLGTDDPSDSVEQELAPFWPSRDQLFLLHFFEQFAASHRVIDPTGRWLTWASHPEPRVGITDHRSRIMALDLTLPDPDPIILAQGSFAVFSPPPGTG